MLSVLDLLDRRLLAMRHGGHVCIGTPLLHSTRLQTLQRICPCSHMDWKPNCAMKLWICFSAFRLTVLFTFGGISFAESILNAGSEHCQGLPVSRTASAALLWWLLGLTCTCVVALCPLSLGEEMFRISSPLNCECVSVLRRLGQVRIRISFQTLSRPPSGHRRTWGLIWTRNSLNSVSFKTLSESPTAQTRPHLQKDAPLLRIIIELWRGTFRNNLASFEWDNPCLKLSEAPRTYLGGETSEALPLYTFTCLSKGHPRKGGRQA